MSHLSVPPRPGAPALYPLVASTPPDPELVPLRSGLCFRELRYPLPTRLLELGGQEIAYHERGRGPRSLLLIHGLGSYLPVWSRVIEGLAEHARVVAIDLPGYGQSSRPGPPYSLAGFADVVQAVIERLGLTQVVLCGHSMGGQIALWHALRHRDRGALRGLCLLAPAGFEVFTADEGRWMRALVTAQSVMATPPELVRAHLQANFCQMPDEARFMISDRLQVIGGPDFAGYAEAVAGSVAAMLAEPVWERLGEIDLPALVVFGSEDRLIPNPLLHPGTTQALAEAGVARLRRGRLVMLERTGHMVPFERPAETCQAIGDFLGGVY